MKYKGYTGLVEYDDDAKIFHGEVIGLRDVITFQGQSVDELEKAMSDSIDFYIGLSLNKYIEKAIEDENRQVFS
ncbi:hypothetical protein MASR2M78_17220 [Treponema sp.]